MVYKSPMAGRPSPSKGAAGIRRLPYTSPRLALFGAVSEITRGQGGSLAGDGQSGMVMAMNMA